MKQKILDTLSEFPEIKKYIYAESLNEVEGKFFNDLLFLVEDYNIGEYFVVICVVDREGNVTYWQIDGDIDNETGWGELYFDEMFQVKDISDDWEDNNWEKV